MKFIGKELGTLALIGLVGSVLNYIVKWYHKNWKNLLKT